MILQKQTARNRRLAFTLMEMIVVVAIIVALAGVGGFYLLGALGGAEKDVARTQCKGPLQTAVQTYYVNNHQWPSSLSVLLNKDANGKGPYLEDQNAIIDPWQKPYQYNAAGTRNNGRRPDISTIAPDGTEIGNWSNSQ
jgi:general secretion pathway protein G